VVRFHGQEFLTDFIPKSPTSVFNKITETLKKLGFRPEPQELQELARLLTIVYTKPKPKEDRKGKEEEQPAGEAFDQTKPPRGSAQVPLPVKDPILRDAVSFSFVAPLYSKPRIDYDEEDALTGVETEFRLYKAVREAKQPPFIIFDADGYVNVKRHDYALVKLDEDTLLKLEDAVPKGVWSRLAEDHNISSSDDEDLALNLHRAGFLVTPVPRLRDVEFLKSMNWRELVEDLVNFKRVDIDPRLVLVRRCHLMRGLKQGINPHVIIVLPGQTGKSEWWKYIGICEDKVSANSLIGYADADGPRPGSLDGAELPFALDQIESSGMFLIFRYMLSLMEIGEARVDMAAFPFDIHSLSPFSILSNPLGDPKSNFAVLIEKLSKNPSLGRRFGMILYDKKAVLIKRREKDLDILKEKVMLFRAVEEYALPEIRKIINADTIWTWLNTRNEEFVKQALELIEPIATESESLFLFLKEFIENGGTHARGGALRAALTMNLDKIALKQYEPADLLSEAEEHLHDILRVNYASIQNIAQSYKQTKEEGDLRTFDMLPTYLKEIVGAVEHWRHSLTDEDHASLKAPIKFYLSSLDYTPQTATYFSQILQIAKRGNPERYNDALKEHFEFEVKAENRDLVVWVYGLAPLPHLKPVRSFSNLGNLDNLAKLGGDSFSESVEKTPSLNSAKMSKLSKILKNEKDVGPNEGKEPPLLKLGMMSSYPDHPYKTPSEKEGQSPAANVANITESKNRGVPPKADLLPTPTEPSTHPIHIIPSSEPFPGECSFCHEKTIITPYLDDKQICMKCVAREEAKLKEASLEGKECGGCAYWSPNKCERFPEMVMVSPARPACEWYRERGFF
jgi:hypothetical protein